MSLGETAELVKAQARSVNRVLEARKEGAVALGDRETKVRLRRVVKPASMSRGLRNAGVALVLAPDPVTAIPGTVMIGASVIMKRREAASLSSMMEETGKLMSEMRNLL